MLFKKMAVVGLSALGLSLGFSRGAVAGGNLVTNGGFESTSNGYGQLGYNTELTGWSNAGYNFVFNSSNADTTTGVTGQFGGVALWGPGNGSNNGLGASPAGGNFVAADGAYDAGPLSQTINGLTIGDSYAVSFYWGGAQQYTFTGENTEQWVVSLGNETQKTAVYDNPSHGFSGWMQESFTFTANATSEVLSFLAVGTPISPSVPPMSLLDGVSMNAVPEPSAISLMVVGALGLGGVYLRRRSRTVAG